MSPRKKQQKPKKKSHKQRGKPEHPRHRHHQETRKKRHEIKSKWIQDLTVVQLKKLLAQNSHLVDRKRSYKHRHKKQHRKKDYLNLVTKLWNDKFEKLNPRQGLVGICDECKCVQRMCIILDCMHMYNCIECADYEEYCPICLEEIQGVIGLYLP